LQVVYATTSTATTVATTTYTDTTLSATITPTSNTSTILIFVNQGGYSGDANADAGGNLRILRGVTTVYEPDISSGLNTNYIGATGATETYLGLAMTMIYQDSPSTTSATTYNNDYSTVVWDILDGDAPTQAEIDVAIEQVKADEAQAVIDQANAKAAAQAKLAALGLTVEDLQALGL
jgi:hypothetical protein